MKSLVLHRRQVGHSYHIDEVHPAPTFPYESVNNDEVDQYYLGCFDQILVYLFRDFIPNSAFSRADGY